MPISASIFRGTPIGNRVPDKDWSGRPKEPSQYNLYGSLEDCAVCLHFENPEGDASVVITLVPSGEIVQTCWDTTHDLFLDLTSEPPAIEVEVFTSAGNTYSGTLQNFLD